MHHHLPPPRQRPCEVAERGAAVRRQPERQIGHDISHAQGLRRQVREVDPGHLERTQSPGARGRHVGWRHAVEQVRQQVEIARLGADRARVRQGGRGGQRLQRDGRPAERLARQQARQQPVTAVGKVGLLVEVVAGRPRQQPAALQVHERGRAQQELRGGLQVEELHAGHLVEVVAHDRCQRDLENVDLVAHDEVHQEFQRPLELRSPNLHAHAASLDVRSRRSRDLASSTLEGLGPLRTLLRSPPRGPRFARPGQPCVQAACLAPPAWSRSGRAIPCSR